MIEKMDSDLRSGSEEEMDVSRRKLFLLGVSLLVSDAFLDSGAMQREEENGSFHLDAKSFFLL